MKVIYVSAVLMLCSCVSMSKYQQMERAYIDIHAINKSQNKYYIDRIDSLELDLVQCQDVEHNRKDQK